MWRYRTAFINCISFIISVIIYTVIINFNTINFNAFLNEGDRLIDSIKGFFRMDKVLVEFRVDNGNNDNNNYNNDNKRDEVLVNSGDSKDTKDKKDIGQESDSSFINREWCISIPSIGLIADIKEGIDQNILNEAVGHFPETKFDYGNVGLAAHNRGYKVNYFSGLKKLKEGDLIEYKYKDFIRRYEVIKHRIIEDTDFSELENTMENRLTLITCVENEPHYRRCIQAIEIK